MDNFSRKDVAVLADESVYDGFFQIRTLNLRHRLFQGGWSQPLNRELIHRHDAVGVLLFDPVLDAVALVEQFRVGVLGSSIAEQESISPWLLELVAGLIEHQDAPQDVAVRESEEEAGVIVQQLEPIGQYYSSPGGSNEYFYLFVGRADLSAAGGVHGLEAEGEDIRVHVLSIEHLWQKLERGRLINAHTLIAAQWLKLNYQQLKTRWAEVAP
ncbi:NUDIX domain-containing protein [Oceanicoccus sp. KOV_DT_Chl]|uniref:NUDIX domain-containing protein n=1 Tax=Oceanicoccus sp. KOV_DT_Chl TaxID=1904639 RepID=UPI000C79E1BF|nr:NUDIX domain-containing protein [Oceanicoccus sp. KOV_DT_Chl]